MTFEAVGSEVAMGVRRHRRYSTEFKLQLVEAYLTGDGSAKGLARYRATRRRMAIDRVPPPPGGELPTRRPERGGATRRGVGVVSWPSSRAHARRTTP